MRGALLHFLVAVGLGLAGLASPPVFAEPAGTVADKTATFADICRRWQVAQDPEEVIALGEQAVALEPSITAWPLNDTRQNVMGEIRFGVGSAYVRRAQGVRADNLERAIGHLEAALTMWTREADPETWAATRANLGAAYWSRVRGVRSDNQEKALAHFEAALSVMAREANPQQWGELQNNLALVYWNRIRGDRADNVEQAIQHMEVALTVFTMDGYPQLWASVRNNLGGAYQVRIKGDRAENRELAIEHMQAALTVFTRETAPREWAQIENNLAIAFSERKRGDKSENQEKTIGYLGEAGTVFTRESFPTEWATIERSLGNAYADRIAGVPEQNRETAIAVYEAALTVFTREAAPLQHLGTSRRLARMLMQKGEWPHAAAVHKSARDAFSLLFGLGLDDANARALLADAGPMFAEAAYVSLQLGDTEGALALVSEGRARLLSAALKLQSIALPPDKRAHLAELQQSIRAGEQAADAAQGTERTEALDKVAAMKQELTALVQDAVSGPSDARPALEAAKKIVAEGSVVAVPIVTEFGGKIVVMSQAANGVEESVIDAPELTPLRLANVLAGPDSDPSTGWIAKYFVNYLSRDEQKRRWPEWTAAIEALGPELWGLFAGRLDESLKAHGVKPGTRLVWLPSGWLGILPLGLAQDPASKRYLADDYAISYAPSFETLAAAYETVSSARPATLAAVINPTGDLPGTEKEGAVVASHFASGSRVLLVRNAATPSSVLAALKGKSHWHFASHGTFSWSDARQSALVMSGRQRLSVGKLLETDGLGHPRLVVLSACETGLSDITGNPDEFTGLPGAFTALGAAGVVSTLWPVSDAATALLMAKFYELHRGEGLDPASALSRAQAWLRSATTEDLNGYARSAARERRIQRRHVTEVRRELSADGMARSPNRGIFNWGPATKTASGSDASGDAQSATRPYAHPYFWAGFIHTGL